jgi:hypothetical protein
MNDCAEEILDRVAAANADVKCVKRMFSEFSIDYIKDWTNDSAFKIKKYV